MSVFPEDFLPPERKKGYQSPEEVERRRKEVLSLFKDEKDRKTFTQILAELKKIGWRSQSSVSRYLKKLLDERKLIREGEVRGALYRCNFVELMELDHFRYLERLRDYCSKNGLDSFHQWGAVDCSMLGIPSEGLTKFEHSIVEAITEQLSKSWLLLFNLRGVVSTRLSKESEIIDFYSLVSLYQHYFYEVLVYVSENLRVFHNPQMIKDLFILLRNTVIHWAEKNEVTYNFDELETLLERYDLEKAAEIRFPELDFDVKDPKYYPEEMVALTVTGSMKTSREFNQRVENWLKYFLNITFQTAKRFGFNKVQELHEVAKEMFDTIAYRSQTFRPSKRPHVLEKTEKERLLNWDLLLKRYGENNTRIIMDIVEKATIMAAEKHPLFKIQDWIAETVYKILEDKGLIKAYREERFWS